MESLLKRNASLLWLVPFSLVLLSVFYAVIQHTAHAVIVNNFLEADDRFTAASVYLLIGAWVGLAVISLTGELILIKRDRSGQGERHLPRPQGKMLWLTLSTGAASAFYTMAGIVGSLEFDAGVTGAVVTGYVLLTIAYEWYGGRTTLSAVLLPGTLVIICTILVAFSENWTQNEALRDDLVKLGLYALGYNILKAYENITTTRVLRHQKYSKVSIQRLRFTALAVVATGMVVGTAIARHQLPELVEAIGIFLSKPKVYVLLLIVFVFVFFQSLTEYEAKEKMEIDLSKISITLSLGVGLNFLVALGLNALDEGIVGEVETGTVGVLIRLIGVIGLMFTLFLLKETKKQIDQVKVN